MTFFPSTVSIMMVALVLELALGYPGFIWRNVGHPVSWMGLMIKQCERMFNSAGRNQWADLIWGVVTLGLMLALVGGIACVITIMCNSLTYGWALLVILSATLLAGRSLHDHVAAVAYALKHGGVEAGRERISLIVGRDPQALDEPAISRAAIETLAENTSDGIVAPLFWGLVAGFPGLAMYKAVNTADSMIGHRSERYEWFGKATARFDDFLNLVPARLTGFLFVVAAMVRNHAGAAFKAMWRDASRHTSPNAGWPEAAMAGALGCQLGGPRTYRGIAEGEAAWLGTGPTEIGHDEITQALGLYKISLFIVVVLLVMASLLVDGGIL